MGKCEKLVENIFSRAFSRTQPNNQTLEKKFQIIFWNLTKYLKIFCTKKTFYIKLAKHRLNLIFSQFWLYVCVRHAWHSKRGKKGKKEKKKEKRKEEDILVNGLEILEKLQSSL